MSMGDLTSFLMLTIFIGASIGSIADLYAQIQKAIGATEQLMEILDETPEEYTVGEIRHKIKGAIELKNLSFHYPNRADIEVLSKIDLTISEGQQIALVGTSGAGKSTITQLIMRFYQNYSGQLTIDKTEIKLFPLSDLRKQIAIVPQDILLFGGSIKENISYGKPDASDQEIQEQQNKPMRINLLQNSQKHTKLCRRSWHSTFWRTKTKNCHSQSYPKRP